MDNSPYLDKPLLPLAVVLRQMLADIEGEIVAAPPAEERRLRRRAELMRWLLRPGPISLP
jgi:hypothetical protein